MSSQNQFLIAVSGPVIVDGFFQTKSGGAPSVSVTRDYDGGSSVPVLSRSRVQYSALTIGRRYDAGRDDVLEAALDPYVGLAHVWTVTVQPTDESFNALGKAKTYLCELTGVNPPDADANGTQNARWGCTFDVLQILP